jgi:hypothetical protein
MAVMKNVMISYSRDDRAYVTKLDQILMQAHIDAWMDEKDIRPPMVWRESIYQAVIHTEFIILCLSRAYVNSEICRMETYLARCYGKKILPIMLDDCWEMMTAYNEFKGISNYYVLNMNTFNSFGLIVNERILLDNLIGVINKTAPDNWSTIDAYVSYKNSTAAYATGIADDLNKVGVKTWVATTGYHAGQDWLEKQWEALMKTSFLIVILNEETASSFYIKNELLVAYTRKIPVLPVLNNSAGMNDETTRAISKSLAINHEMRTVGEIGWFYPNKPDYNTMIKDLARCIRPEPA